MHLSLVAVVHIRDIVGLLYKVSLYNVSFQGIPAYRMQHCSHPDHIQVRSLLVVRTVHSLPVRHIEDSHNLDLDIADIGIDHSLHIAGIVDRVEKIVRQAGMNLRLA